MAGAVNDKYPSFTDGAIGADRHWLELLANNPYNLLRLIGLTISAWPATILKRAISAENNVLSDH